MIQHHSTFDPIDRATLIPPLEPGDHLSRAEFERRYDAMPDLKKAELIEGVVHMASPVRWQQHGEPHIIIAFWFGAYLTGTPHLRAGDNISIRLDDDSMPQPDAALMIDPTKGGQARLSQDGYVEGPPELIVEVAASTASIDLHTKFEIYQRHNVLEYVVWRVLDRVIDWFSLQNGVYHRVAASEDGLLRSRIFPGLWLDPAALIVGNYARILEVVQMGIVTPEHQAFVARLQARV